MPVTAPVPFVKPFTNMLFEQFGLERIAQLSVALNLNLREANNVCGSAGKGNVPKSQTIDPVAPKFGSKNKLLGVGFGVKNIELFKLPGTKVDVKGIGITSL